MDALPTKILLTTDGSEDAYLAARAAIDGRQESWRFGGKPRTALRGKCPPGANSPQALGRRPSEGDSGSLGSR
jgi:hypothetical protein